MRAFAVLLAACLVGILPFSAFGQTFPVLPSFGGYGGYSGLTPGFDRTSFMVGYSAHRNGAVFGLNADGPGSLGLFGNSPYLGNTRTYPVKGVWLGGSLDLSLNDRLSTCLSGAYFLPTDSGMAEIQDWLARGVLYTQAQQNWTTDIEWWYLDGEGAYALSDSFAVIGGFRLDIFRTLFRGELPPTIGPGTALPGAESDLDIFLYLPYVGVKVSRDWGAGELNARLIGFPCLPGSADFATTRNTLFGVAFFVYDRFEASGAFDSGHFIEASAEYGVRYRGLMASLFAKYDLVHGKAKVELDRTQASFLGVGGSDLGYSLSFDRRVWTLGGRFELLFTSPF